MVLVTMTVKEILACVVDDIDVLTRRVIGYFGKKYRKDVLRRGKFPFWFRHETVMESGNKYINIGCVTSRKMALRGIALVMSFLVVETDGGKVLVRVAGTSKDKMHLTFFTPHFWSRYRERMNMGNISFPELVQRFAERNCSQGFPISKLRNDNIEYELAINDGSVMVQDIEGKFTAKTFISTKTFGKTKQDRYDASAVDMMQIEDLDDYSKKFYRTPPAPKVEAFKIPQLSKVS